MKYQQKDRRDDERRPRKSTSERSNSERTSSSRSRRSNENTERPIRSSSPRDKFGKDDRSPRDRRSSSDFGDRPKRTSYKDNAGSSNRRTSSSEFSDKTRERRSSSEFSDKPRARRSDSDFNDRPKRTSYKENQERSNRRTSSSDFSEKPRERRSSSEFSDRPRERRSNSEFSDKPKARRNDSEFNDRRTNSETEKTSKSTDRAKRFNSEKTKRASRVANDQSTEKKSSKGSVTSFSKKAPDDLIRLNRYISNSGVCSRRKADELILNGEVTVNGEVVKELGFKVKVSDKIKFQGKLLKPGNLEYILLNKPKDFITTTDDPLERKTVMDLVRNASTERVYPVGRLDRNTTGLLLFTNDGELADRLAHPRNQVRKIYEVELDKSLNTNDFEKIKEGLELEDGLAKVDTISYLDGKSKKHVGVEIHIGRNRIVRRIFESLGYEVIKLDRVVYAGLTKKDLPRGRFRHLTKEEIIYLKHLNKY